MAIAEEEFKWTTNAVAPALPVKEAIREPRNAKVMCCCKMWIVAADLFLLIKGSDADA